MDGILLKQRIQSSSPPSPAPLRISFRHPGYHDGDDILFTLPRLDLPAPGTQAGAVGGVHHGTALLACQIIADNAFDGYLSTDRNGNNRVSIGLDMVLLEDDYWFIVNRNDDDAAGGGAEDAGIYPVVPKFEEWEFAHSHMASLPWNPLQPGSSTPTRPPAATATPSIPLAPPPPPSAYRCILTNNPYAVQKAHVVPTAQKEWFQMNGMIQYIARDLQFIHAEQNQVRMRHDLHTLWDTHTFALVPKRGGGRRDFVIHALGIPRSGVNEFASEWHNTPVQEGALDNVEKAFLFARFAQAVFMLLKPFIAFPMGPRYVATFKARAEDPRFPTEKQSVWVSASDLRQRYSGGGSRSASAESRKRSWSQISGDGNDDEDDGGRYTRNVRPRWWSSESEDEDDWYERNVAGGEERGRPRTRLQWCETWSQQRSEHPVDTVPSLTDTSAAGDPEDQDHGGSVAPTSTRNPSDNRAFKGAALVGSVLDGDMPSVQDTA